MIALNAAMAEALTDFKHRVDAKIAEYSVRSDFSENSGHTARFHAIIDVLREDIKTCKPVRFDGNGYSEQWVKEAARRGLDTEKSCPVIFEHYLDPSSIRMFESTKVMTAKELEARNEVKWEMYVKTVQIEARVMGDLSMNHIIPVATHYQSQLIKNVQGMKSVFTEEKANRLSARNMKLIEEIAERTERIEQFVEELTDARRVANRIQDIHQRAIAYHDSVCPHMQAIRNEADHLEMIVEDGLWTLPKYRELLFIR
jgi:glutamine synthetase